MKKLLEIEWKRGGLWVLFGCAIFLVLIVVSANDVINNNDLSELSGIVTLLPYFVTNIVMIRTAIVMDQDDVLRTYRLLPVSPAIIVGSKFVFTNMCFLIMMIITEIYLVIISKFVDDPTLHISIIGQLIWISVALLATNLTLFGYYLLGAQNIQVVGFIAMIALMFASRYLGDITPEHFLFITIPIVAIIISIVLYRLSCQLLVTDFLGHISKS